MDDNNLLMIVLAFVVGFMLQGMMKNMCGGRLIEGSSEFVPGCSNKYCCGDHRGWSPSGYCAYCDRDPKDHLMCASAA